MSIEVTDTLQVTPFIIQDTDVEDIKKGVHITKVRMVEKKFKLLEQTPYNIKVADHVFNFFGARADVTNNRVVMAVDGNRLVSFYVNDPVEATRYLAVFTARECVEDTDELDIVKLWATRGIQVTYMELTRGNFALQENVLYEFSKTISEYDILNVVTTKSGVGVGEKIVLAKSGDRTDIYVITSLGVLTIDLQGSSASTALYENICEIALQKERERTVLVL